DTGRVIGDLLAPRIGVSEGAQLRGGVRTEGNGSAPVARAQRAVSAEPRSVPMAVERPRPAVVAAPPPVAAAAPRPVAVPAQKAPPPPPVIPAPRPGARARKKLARR